MKPGAPEFLFCLLMAVGVMFAAWRWIKAETALNREKAEKTRLALEVLRLRACVFHNPDNWSVGPGHVRHQ